MLTEQQAVEIFKSEFAKTNPNHDSMGRFTSADAQAEGAAGEAARRAAVRDDQPEGGAIRNAFRALATVAHAKAAAFASSIKHTITSTRLSSVSPTVAGGVEIQTNHRTPGGAVIRSVVQANPAHVSGSPAAARALALAHSALIFAGHRNVPVRSPAVSATMSRS